MISLKRKQSGFTIVELLIVIDVIGILAALVVTTFSGIQRKARNAERQSDIKAIHTQLEAYYNEANSYPTLDQMNDTSSDARTKMKSLDPEALKDPQGTNQTLAAAAGAKAYAYIPTGCGADGCTGYALTATEEPNTPYTKNNLN